MSEDLPRGRAAQHHLVMALRTLSEIPGGPAFTAYDRATKLFRLTAADGSDRALTAADVPVYLAGAAHAAAAIATPSRKQDRGQVVAQALTQLPAAVREAPLPTGARLAPYLQGVQDASDALAARPTSKRRSDASAYAQAAAHALPGAS
ncbi:hypothetical protein AB0D90_03740 [Streptomyces althioticus]|uniref:hypothetical protein n=1 Tax=Streptomyces althioticus TaxID=83380 RepID=UPI0033CB8DDD